MKLSTKISRILLKEQIITAASDYAYRFARGSSLDIEDNFNTLSKTLNKLLKIKWEKD